MLGSLLSDNTGVTPESFEYFQTHAVVSSEKTTDVVSELGSFTRGAMANVVLVAVAVPVVGAVADHAVVPVADPVVGSVLDSGVYMTSNTGQRSRSSMSARNRPEILSLSERFVSGLQHNDVLD